MAIRIVIGGSRDFENYDLFCKAVDSDLSEINEEITILSGHCRGIDLIAEKYAKERGYLLEIFPADWEKYGRAAAVKRNAEMVKVADMIIAFPGGKGTENLIKSANKKGILVKIHAI